MEPKPRVGRIRYINVLPIYHAIDQAWVDNSFPMVSGTPAELNSRLYEGLLDVSAISSFEVRPSLSRLSVIAPTGHSHPG